MGTDDSSHFNIFIVNSWSFEFTSKLKQQGMHEKFKILKKVIFWRILEFKVILSMIKCKKQEKLKIWKNGKNVSRFGISVTRIYQTKKHALDIREKRVTIAKTWHDFFSCLWKRVTIYLKRDTILGEFLSLFKLKSIMKTRVTNWEEQSAILRPKDV